jgi:hypothetical protein
MDEIGFHCLEVDESLLVGDKEVKEHEAIVITAENRFNSELLTQDLKALVEDNRDWQVRRVNDTDCGGFFFTKASLTLCKNLCRNASGIALPVSKVSVLFGNPQPFLRPSMSLSKIWVHLSGTVSGRRTSS